jgi:N-6 DNA Methylase
MPLVSAVRFSLCEMKALDPYVDEMATLLRHDVNVQGLAVLNGEVARELRGRVTIGARRAAGAFFTGAALSQRLVRSSDLSDVRVVCDPALGTGDLLLAAARHLPTSRSVAETLARWGHVLHGTDVQETFVRAARIRLAILAMSRLQARCRIDEWRLSRLLPHLKVADGQEEPIPAKALILLNPPYGTIAAPAGCLWGSGGVSRAAAFSAGILERCPDGTRIAAILPDVLRSGSRSARWRAHVESLIQVESADPVGQFDEWADVDVFVLRGVAGAASGLPQWIPAVGRDTVGTRFDVHVGPVVPHRDLETGPYVPYLAASDVPRDGAMTTTDAPLRRFAKTTFEPPFVVVRRTSRPQGTGRRAVATVIEGAGSVAVENHLLVCKPRGRSIEECRDLQRALHTGGTDAWLDERIRCRHLTVAALAEVPWCQG